MDRLLNVLTGFSIGVIILVLASVRRSHIRVEYSVSWLGAAVAILVLSRSKTIMTDLADMLGITYPPLAILVVVMILFLLVFYRFSLILSELKDANIALAQKVAILEFRQDSWREKNEEAEAGRA
ncbi:MAG: DUF2304 domain-containing protein [Bryobacteraceae bacterium]